MKGDKKSNQVVSNDQLSLMQRLFTVNRSWDSKDEFLDAVYWTRQVVALLLGLIWGAIGLTGFVGITSFVAVNTLFVYLYATKFNKDSDSVSEGVKEGFMSAFSVFMVSWIIAYSASYY